MFSKSQSAKQVAKTDVARERSTQVTRTADAPPSIISVDMRIKGDLTTDGDVQVDGTVDGNIRSHTLSVGKTAEINGEIYGEVIRIWGRVNGMVRGKEVTLMDTADVRGDILHESIEVARGANIEGMVRRGSKDEERPLLPKVNLVVNDGQPAQEAESGTDG